MATASTPYPGLPRRALRTSRRALAAYCVCLAVLPSAFAQEADRPIRFISEDYLYDQWTVNDGLPLNAVPSLDQSTNGYLWAGTLDGLARFDGNRFKVFNMTGYEAMPSNRTVQVLKAGGNGAFFGTEEGHLLHVEGSRLRRLDQAHDAETQPWMDVVQESDGTWLIAVGGSLYRYDGRLMAPIMADVFNSPVDALLIGRAGDLWVAARDGVYRIRDERVLNFIPSSAGLPKGRIETMVEAADGAVWAGSRWGVSIIRGGSAQPLAGVPDSVELSALYLYADPNSGSVWVGALDGLYKYRDGELIKHQSEIGRAGSRRRTVQFDAEGNRWIAVVNRLYRNEDLVLEAGSDILDVVPDEEHGVWIGTVSNGLIRLRPRYIHALGERDGLYGDNAYTVVEGPDGSIWVGSASGVVSRYSGGRLTHYPVGGHAENPMVMSLFFDRDGILWAGTGQAVCRLLDDRWWCFEDEGPPRGWVTAGLFQDSRGTYWLGTRRGVFRYDGAQWTTPDDDPRLRLPFIRVFAEAPDGSILMGSAGNGLVRYHDGRVEASDHEHLSGVLLRAIYQDTDGVIWLGTEGRGLVRVVLPDGGGLADASIAAIRQADGLYDETIHQILEDAHGRLWMSTNRGIFYASRDALNAYAEGRRTQIPSVVHTERDGMLNREANGGGQNAGIRSSDGRLWFPTQRGVVVIDPARIPPPPPSRPIQIEEVRDASGELMADGGTVHLPLGRRGFEIVYTVAAFGRPEIVNFRYRMEGLEREWTSAGTRRTAYYTGVPPGTYTFLVEASNEVGEWSDAPAALQIVVPAFFYETRWFLVLCVGLMLMILAAAVRYRTHRLLRRQEELTRIVEESTCLIKQHERELEEQNVRLQEQAAALMKLDELKSRFFADISHEFRTPLTLVIGPLEDALEARGGSLSGKERERLQLALSNARRLLRLIRQILDLSRIEAGHMTLNASPLDAGAYIRRIYAGFTPLAERKQMTFEFDVPPEPVTGMFDSDALEKIVTNLLSNAFKFTPEGGRVLLSVSVRRTDEDVPEHLDISVRDSGRGISAERLSGIFDRFVRGDTSDAANYDGAGIGLALVRELVTLHGGTITVDSRVGFGSEFTVSLPLRRTAATAPTPASAIAGAADIAGDGESGEPAAPDRHPYGDDVPTVLIVDDNADIRLYIREHLESRFRVEEASDGASGLEKAAALLPDLVIADVMMPRLDGYDFCRKVRANSALDRIPIILLTAKASEDSMAAGLAAGADEYITKPFSARDLEARINSHIQTRRRLVASVERHLHAQTPAPGSAPSKDAFLDRVRETMLKNLSDGSFSVDDLAEAVGLSRTQLYRRVRSETGVSPGDYFREMRLHHAAALILQDAGTISEIAYASGFNSLSYFSRCFKERFGKLPSEYREG